MSSLTIDYLINLILYWWYKILFVNCLSVAYSLMIVLDEVLSSILRLI